MPAQAARRKREAEAGMAQLERKAAEAAALLKLLANENRLLILCRLALEREMSVNDLADAVGLSQSALSQHLAKMREEGLLATRRDAQTVYYRIADPNAAKLLGAAQEHLLPVTTKKPTRKKHREQSPDHLPRARRRASPQRRRAGRHPRSRRACARAHPGRRVITP